MLWGESEGERKRERERDDSMTQQVMKLLFLQKTWFSLPDLHEGSQLSACLFQDACSDLHRYIYSGSHQIHKIKKKKKNRGLRV